jgi:hypothetical protein
MDKSKVNIPEKFKDHPIFNERICGTNFGFMAKRGYYLRPETIEQPKIMRENGINWTTLNMNFCQKNYFSTDVYLDFEYSSSAFEISEMVKRLHAEGIRVLFKPALTLLDGGWMGLVRFPEKGQLCQINGVRKDYWGDWFTSFTEALKYFSDLSERIGVDALILGAEYFGTEGQNQYWENVIKEVRNNYGSPISYEFTCESRKHYDLKWMDTLDFLCYSYYPPAAPRNEGWVDDLINPTIKDNPHYTVEEMQEYLFPRRKRILSISERFGNKPIAFTEFGVRSAHGCCMEPYNFMWDSPYDGQEQANYMEAAFRTFDDLDPWMGLFWWKWDETQDRPQYKGDPNGDRGFTIQGKPAADVMRKWFLDRKK